MRKCSRRMVLGQIAGLLSCRAYGQQVDKQKRATKKAARKKDAATSGNPLPGAKLFHNPYTDPANYVRNRKGNAKELELMNKLAQGPETQWFGDWNQNVARDLDNWINQVENQRALPCFVLYNIPLRDKGEYSAGGQKNPDGYRAWIREVAKAIGNRMVAVILEPDALAQFDRLTRTQQRDRSALIEEAVTLLKKNSNCAVYIDSGHPRWHAANIMVDRLKQAGIDKADGFSINISNFCTDVQCIAYGTEISRGVGNKHFVIDCGRNGNGPPEDGQFCNPPGRALGKLPTTDTGHPLVDALLWIKGPGGSDGDCHLGDPPAGNFFPAYALELARNAKW